MCIYIYTFISSSVLIAGITYQYIYMCDIGMQKRLLATFTPTTFTCSTLVGGFNDPQRLHLFVMNNHHQYLVPQIIESWMTTGDAQRHGCKLGRPLSRPFVRLLLNLKPKSLSELQATIGKDCPLVNEQPSSKYKSW